MVIGLLVLTFVLIEVIALIMLYRNLGGYQKFWNNHSKNNGQLTYVALGDSAAQGLGASHPLKGYVGQIAQRLATQSGKTVRIVNLSKSGAVIQDVITTQLPQLKNYKADLITVEIGANNIARFEATTFKKEFTDLASKLPDNTYVSNMPYFGSRPKRRAAAFEASKIIEPIVASHPKLNFVDLQTITQERDSILGYAADYFHPNNRAYKNWADAFWTEIRQDKQL